MEKDCLSPHGEKVNEILEFNNMIIIREIYVKMRRLITKIVFFFLKILKRTNPISNSRKLDYCGFYMGPDLPEYPLMMNKIH